MELVKAKKYLGQHFLKDLNIAQKIAELEADVAHLKEELAEIRKLGN